MRWKAAPEDPPPEGELPFWLARKITDHAGEESVSEYLPGLLLGPEMVTWLRIAAEFAPAGVEQTCLDIAEAIDTWGSVELGRDV